MSVIRLLFVLMLFLMLLPSGCTGGKPGNDEGRNNEPPAQATDEKGEELPPEPLGPEGQPLL